jgi:hypothetical protein
MHCGGRVQTSGLGFLDKVGNLLNTAGNVASKGLDVAQKGYGVYEHYQTVFSPQQQTPTGTSPLFTTAPYGGLPSNIMPVMPAVSIGIAQAGSPSLDTAGIRELQGGLAALGYKPGPVDGIFGSLTESALMNFQRAKCVNPDGAPTAFNLSIVQAELQNKRQGGGISPAILAGGALALLLLSQRK